MLIYVPGCSTFGQRCEANRRNRSLKMHWSEFEEDDARRDAAIEQIEPMINTGRLLFATNMGKAQECHKQFVHSGLVEENGIVECVSKFADLVPLSVSGRP